ncbi:hypothetical protein B7463_g4772, partial [Scytalidium lignicola]
MVFSLRSLAAVSALAPLVVGTNTTTTVNSINSVITSLKSVNYGTSFGSTCACDLLSLVLGKQSVLFPGSTNYTTQATHYYTTRVDLSPKCVFVPNSVNDVAIGVVILDVCQSNFAIRGAGHMPVLAAANTDGGVLVAMSSFTDITLSRDKTTVDVEPAADWYQVNVALEPYGLTAIGGRLKTIGVAGLTLGGGISYFAAKYGFAMDNVAAYQVVLASGEVVTASASSNSDLFWALKGGGNNFGIVTKFTLLVYPLPSVSTAIISYGQDAIPAWVSAVADFANYQDQVDTNAGGIFDIGYTPGVGFAPLFMGVQSGNTVQPAVFSNFSAIPNQFSSYNVTSLAYWSSTIDTPYQQARWVFGMHSMVADNSSMQEMYNIFAAACPEMDSIDGFTITLTYQPLPKSAFAVAATNGIGNTWGLDDTKNYVFWLLSVGWANQSDDNTVMSWGKSLREKMHSSNIAKGTAESFMYMNDSADDQDAIGSYPKASISKLQSIRRKYDPTLVFTNLVTGGFKVPV